MDWEITFTTLGELPRLLLFLVPMCMLGATPMLSAKHHFAGGLIVACSATETS